MINNYNDNDIVIVKAIPHFYLVFGYEVGESDIFYLQGFIILKGNKRLTGMKKFHATVHWE